MTRIRVDGAPAITFRFNPGGGLQVDRDADGYPVRRIAYRPNTVPLDMRWMEVHAGRRPVAGTADYGQPWNDVPGQPLILSDWAAPRIGTRFGVTLHWQAADMTRWVW